MKKHCFFARFVTMLTMLFSLTIGNCIAENILLYGSTAAPTLPLTQNGITISGVNTSSKNGSNQCSEISGFPSTKIYMVSFSSNGMMTIDAGAGKKITSLSLIVGRNSSGSTSSQFGHGGFSTDNTNWVSISALSAKGYDKGTKIDVTVPTTGDYRYYTFGRGTIGSTSPTANAEFRVYEIIITVTSTSGGGDDQGGGQQGGQQGGGQQGGSSTDCGELIKVVLSGDRAATQTVTGTVGGTAGVKNMGSSSPYKLNTDGAYVYVKLADGHYFQTGDVLTIDGSKAMEVHTGDIANGNSTMLDHTAGPSNGVITYTLPASLPANTNTLSVYRSSSTYNGTLTYMSVNRTCTGPAPLSTDATLSDLKVDGVTVAGFNPNTTTYNVTIPATQTTAPVVTATKNDTKAANPTIQQATLPAPGQTTTATVSVTAEDGTTTKTYTINFTRAAQASNDATLRELKYNGTSVPNFSATTLTYSVVLPYGTTSAANVTATPNDAGAIVQITQPTAAVGTATVVVTAEDGTATKTYTISFTVAEEDVPPVPPTTLTLHTPGTYEEKSLAGGYETPLTIVSGREYEVYYAGRDNNSSLTITTTPAIKTDGICSTRSTTGCQAQDGWLEVSEPLSTPSTYTVVAQDEFAAGNSAIHKIQGGYYKLHIKGYDQFSIYAMDNNTDKSKGKYIEVRVDNILQDMPLSTTATVRRFDLTTGEHVIEVKGLGASNDQMIAFSLRIAQEPRLKKIKGNDSTQNVLVTTAMKPITYFTKYNAMGRTELVWDGAQATGITLTPSNSSSIGDTLLLGGTAQCATGTYNFHVVAYNAQNKETSRENGKITISTKIQRQTSDSLVEGFTGEAIDDIQFRYYALSADSVTLTWNRVAPAGISGSGTNGIYTITGTPTQTGDFPFTISVKSGNSIVGMLRVQTSELGANPILYLYKNTYDNTFYQNMRSSNYNLVARKAKSTLRETSQYAAYDLIIISEDVDANNTEAMAAAEGQIAKPVLNMKGFTYAADRLGWGDPDNGSIVNTKITVMQPTHPVFNGLNATDGGQIQILDTVTGKGLMPVKVEKDGSLCLATAATRGREYNTDGAQQTFLHEIPAAQRNGQKYLLFPLAAASSDKLTANGKKLLQNCIDYLKNNTVSPVALPELQITSFTVNGTAAAINQNDNTIELVVPKGTDLTHVTPVLTLKDSKTHATPRQTNNDGTIDLSDDFYGLTYCVTDYINVRTYTVYARIAEGLEEIYADGEWINIYDIQGRKIMTTNESLHQLSLSRGMYIVVTSRGNFKILR